MQVFVSPRMRVRDLGNGRWKLVSEDEPGDDIHIIDGALWKRVDGYFIVDNEDDRFYPNLIKGYRSELQKPDGSWRSVDDFSVDEQEKDRLADGKVYCGPDEDGFETGDDSRCANLPVHGSERITELELKLEWPGGPDEWESPPVERP